MFKVCNKNNRIANQYFIVHNQHGNNVTINEIRSKQTIKTPERRQ